MPVDPDRNASRRGGEHLPRDWDSEYGGTPPWDIGRPQRPFVELASEGLIRGRVLDIGCGTGEHALLAAEVGADAVGVDVAPSAIASARAKAEDRGLDARFVTQDVLAVESPDEPFDVILDCGFFHVLSDTQRIELAAALRRITAPGSEYFMLCFNDKVPGHSGPRRITQQEIRETFATGFTIQSIEESYLESSLTTEPIPAWLVRIVRSAV